MKKYYNEFNTIEEMMIQAPSLEVPNVNKVGNDFYFNKNKFIQEDNKIYYITTDNNILTNFVSTGYGANLIDNRMEGNYGVLVFDGDVTGLPDSCFLNQNRLKGIMLPDKIQISGDNRNIMANCQNLEYVKFSNILTDIWGYCLTGTKIVNIYLPASLTTLRNIALLSMPYLVNVYLPAPRFVGASYNNMFNGCNNLLNIYVPKDLVETYKNDPDGRWSAYADKIKALPE